MNLPDIFQGSKNILLAGVGGGFDIFGGLPLWVKLRNEYDFTFSSYNGLTKDFSKFPVDYPESKLHELLDKNEAFVTFYSLPKAGVRSYVRMYEQIVRENGIDTVVAIDGGVDSLMRGNEEDSGTILEDFANLIALNEVECKKKFLVCLGFGAELEENICHHHVLENIASLVQIGGFLGSCSLLKDTEEFSTYKQICEWVWSHGRKSHIQTKVISSVLGKFGDVNVYEGIESNVVGNAKVMNYITPFMSMYWFFDLVKVMSNNVLYSTLKNTNTKTDLLMAYRQTIDDAKRKRKDLPL